jgi:predicted transcriptional regulator
MDEKMRRVLMVFTHMNSDTLDLHTLFEAEGNVTVAREEVIDTVARLVGEGYLQEQGSDFYSLTERGREAVR